MKETHVFTAKLWKYKGHAAWHFVTLAPVVTRKIKALKIPRRGFGSIRVRISIGDSTWDTSIFPDKTKGYVFPVKAKIRKKENLEDGDLLKVTLKRI